MLYSHPWPLESNFFPCGVLGIKIGPLGTFGTSVNARGNPIMKAEHIQIAACYNIECGECACNSLLCSLIETYSFHFSTYPSSYATTTTAPSYLTTTTPTPTTAAYDDANPFITRTVRADASRTEFPGDSRFQFSVE